MSDPLLHPIPRKWSAKAAEDIEDNFRRLAATVAVPGTTGTTGTAGPQGPIGVPGLEGDAGDDGFPGPTGATGAMGATGAAGTAGVVGQIGPPGTDGIDGDDGPMFLPLDISQRLDQVDGSVAVGNLIVRGTTRWQYIAAGTIGQFLGANGTGIVPTYQATTGGSSPLATANHIDYIVDAAAAWKSNHGGAGSITGTTTGWPATAFTDGPYGQLGTAASTNSTASATSQTSGTNKELNFVWDFDLTFIVYTDASAVTTVRYMLGVGVNNENADPVTGNYIGFRFNTATPDTQWVGVTYDGTQAVTGNIAAIAANTRYALRIRKVSGTVFFSVNGGAETSTTSHVPTNNAYASIVVRCTTLANAVRSLWLGRTWCDFGS